MARHFTSGSSHHITVDATPITAVPLTMSCWFLADDVTNGNCLVSVCRSDFANQWWGLEARGDVAGDPVRARAETSSSGIAVTSSGFSADTWHHALAVFTTATSRDAYIDGGSKGSNATSIAPSGQNRISIGRYGDSSPSNYMNGRICEVAIWPAALALAEIVALASGVPAYRIRPFDLLVNGFYAPLWGLSSPEPDLSNNGNSPTVTGAVKVDHAPVTLFTPKWAASNPLIEVAIGGDVRSHIIPAYMRVNA